MTTTKIIKKYASDNDMTLEEAKMEIENNWGKDGLKGYRIFSSDFPQSLHIERIDELDIFSSDIEAAKQAEKDGIKLIPWKEQPHNYPFNAYRFIDTVENREMLKAESE